MSGVNTPRGRQGAAPPVLRRIWQTTLADHIIALCWSPDGRMLAAAAISGAIGLLTTEQGTVQQLLPGHGGLGSSALDWHPDSMRLTSSGQDGRVRVWEPQRTTRTRAWVDGTSAVTRLAWSPDDTRLAVGYADGTVAV